MLWVLACEGWNGNRVAVEGGVLGVAGEGT